MMRFIVYLISFFFLFLTIWLNKEFDSPSLDQVLYHAAYIEEMADKDIAIVFFIICIIVPIFLSLLLIGQEKQKKLTFNKFLLTLLFISISYSFYSFSVFNNLSFLFKEDYFAKHYVNPLSVEIKPTATPKNLILIYVESLEDGYINKEIFKTDPLVSLKNLKGVSFSNYIQTIGAQWTSAALVSTQCGIPLKSIFLYNKNLQGRKIKSYLPKATCLGDILKTYGYKNVFMNGAPLVFAGKGKFLKNHNYDEAFGKDEWLERGIKPENMHEWGLFDKDLFQQARIKLEELHNSGKPFNLTLLTIDTHGPQGYLSPSCKKMGGDSFEDIVKCSVDQVADFVEFIKTKGYLKDSNIVIIGDHLAMSTPLENKLKKTKRSIFNKFISENITIKNREEILGFDLFPTILEFIGFDVDGDRLGLGYSGFSAGKILPAENRKQEFEKHLMNYSQSYLELWGLQADKDN